jgi:hypothetical protein
MYFRLLAAIFDLSSPTSKNVLICFPAFLDIIYCGTCRKFCDIALKALEKCTCGSLPIGENRLNKFLYVPKIASDSSSNSITNQLDLENNGVVMVPRWDSDAIYLIYKLSYTFYHSTSG